MRDSATSWLFPGGELFPLSYREWPTFCRFCLSHSCLLLSLEATAFSDGLTGKQASHLAGSPVLSLLAHGHAVGRAPGQRPRVDCQPPALRQVTGLSA